LLRLDDRHAQRIETDHAREIGIVSGASPQDIRSPDTGRFVVRRMARKIVVERRNARAKSGVYIVRLDRGGVVRLDHRSTASPSRRLS
jgi:hypothetical protein